MLSFLASERWRVLWRVVLEAMSMASGKRTAALTELDIDLIAMILITDTMTEEEGTTNQGCNEDTNYGTQRWPLPVCLE